MLNWFTPSPPQEDPILLKSSEYFASVRFSDLPLHNSQPFVSSHAALIGPEYAMIVPIGGVTTAAGCALVCFSLPARSTTARMRMTTTKLALVAEPVLFIREKFVRIRHLAI